MNRREIDRLVREVANHADLEALKANIEQLPRNDWRRRWLERLHDGIIERRAHSRLAESYQEFIRRTRTRPH